MDATVDTNILNIKEGFTFESGQQLPGISIAYETYGRLNATRSNAILIQHALSGNAHAAGYNPGDKKPGWWDSMIGPGRAFDTQRYFIICSNVIGGCSGSTGPASINPLTGKEYGLDFPATTIRDMVRAQIMLLDHLGIEKVLSVVGGSMGGMQAQQFICDYSGRAASFICIATTTKHSAQQIAFNEVGRRAIIADPRWNGGDYYNQVVPEGGLSVARMIGHITYLSEQRMQEKFGRSRKDAPTRDLFRPSFEVQHYLDHQGLKFVKRFDANTYLYVTHAVDNFDLLDSVRNAGAINLKGLRGLVISFSSDWLYPPEQGREIVKVLSGLNAQVSYAEIESDHGHDSFLTDIDAQSRIVSGFLDSFGC